MSRVKSTLKNIKYAVVGQALAIIVSFFSRMIFIQTLGSEYLGLNGLFTNILSILSFAELGIGSAIVYSLYKPLAERDTKKIKALMNLYKKTYTIIGVTVAILGILITPFLNTIIKETIADSNIYFYFLLFVMNSAISYFYIYKRSLIIADQKRYIATLYRYAFFVIMNLAQIATLLLYKNYILYLIIQIVFTFVENYIVSKKAEKLFPFLREKNKEKLDDDTKVVITKNIKAMMGHKMGGIVVNGIDNLLISKFFGIVAVGKYSNYLLIIQSLNTIVGMLFQQVIASIGNLGVVESKKKTYEIFKSLDLIGFWIYGVISICLYNLMNEFIAIWIGDEYLFSEYMVFLIVLVFYLNGMRKSVLTFRDALGLFWYDRYKPIFEALVKLLFSILLAYYIGMEGILWGSIISILSTCFWVEPFVLFRYGLNYSIFAYFKRYIINTLVLVVIGYITWLLVNSIQGEPIMSFIYKTIICTVVPNILLIITFWKTNEFKKLIVILKKNVIGK